MKAAEAAELMDKLRAAIFRDLDRIEALSVVGQSFRVQCEGFDSVVFRVTAANTYTNEITCEAVYPGTVECISIHSEIKA